MSICTLNRKKDLCLPDNVIKDIENNILKTNKNTSSQEIIKELADNFNCKKSNNNENEICILDNIKSDVAEKHKITYFKPITKSLSKDYWMNNTDIDTIQYQLQLNYEGYYHSNIHMIDLQMFKPNNHTLLNTCIYPIKDINFIDEINEKNNKLTCNGKLKNFGMVINTDTSDGNGLHWFSIFIDFSSTPITIEYFNSSGYDIKNIKFKTYFINLADDIKYKCRDCKFVKVTSIQHQNDDTSNCGAYSLFYIYSRLAGLNYKYFENNKITDKKMEEFRGFLFRKKIN